MNNNKKKEKAKKNAKYKETIPVHSPWPCL